MCIAPSAHCPNRYQETETSSIVKGSDVLKLTYTHNQPVASTHAISFQDLLEEAKQGFYNLFEMGHSVSLIRHARQQAPCNQAECEAAAQNSLADHA